MMNVEITGPTSAKEQKPNHDRFERNARIIIYLSSLAGFLLLGNSIYLTINAGADPLSIGVYALELLMSLAGIWLVHSGRYRTAVNIVVGFNLVAMIILPFVSGQGISQQTIFLAPWLILIALLTLEWKNARIVIGTALLSAITSVLLDLYLPFEREALIGSNFPLFITLGVMILLLTYVAFRQLPTATIRTRLLSGFVGLVIIPLILVTAYSAYINFRTSRNELEIELASITDFKSREIFAWLNEMEDKMNLLLQEEVEHNLAAILLQNSPTTEEYQAAIKSIGYYASDVLATKVGDDFSEIFLLNMDGQVIVSSDAEQVGKIFANQAFFLNGQTEYTVQPPIYSISTNTFEMYLARPFEDEHGHIAGVLTAKVNLAALNEIMTNRVGLGKSGETYIVGLNHALMTESRFDYPVHKTYIRTAATNQALEEKATGSTSVAYEGYHGSKVVGAYTWLPELQSALITEFDEDERLTPLYNAVWVQGGIAFVASMLAVVVAILVTRSITNPLKKLVDTTANIAKGDYSSRINLTTEDELAILGLSFNKMAEQVGTLITDLEERNVEMTETLGELKIRTLEMEASQRVTFAASEHSSPEDLLNLVVNLIRDQFNLYHAQVYVLDEDKENAVLRDSTGYAGRMLLQRNHSIPMDKASLVTQSIKAREPVLVAETKKNPNWLPNELLPETQSELVVPLIVGDDVLGALDIQSRDPGYFTEHSIPLFQQMTNQVAFLFENAALLGDATSQKEILREFTNQLRTAAEIAERINMITDLDRLLEEAVNQLQLRLGFYHAHIYLLDDNNEDLVVQAGSGHVGTTLKRNKHAIPLSREASLVARAARERMPVVVDDVRNEDDWLPNPLLPETLSEAAIPLVSGERLLGVLDLQDTVIGRFTQADVDTLITLAGQMSSAIISAELFHNVEMRARRTNLRYEVTQSLSGDLSEDQILDKLVNLCRQFPDSQLGISLASELDDGDLVLELVRSSAYESGLAVSPLGTSYKMSEAPVIRELKPDPSKLFVANNILTDDRFDPGIRNYFTNQGIVSLIVVSLAVAGKWIGIIRLGSSKAEYFDDEKQFLYEVIAQQASTALQSARLRAEVEQREAWFRTMVNYAPDAILVLNYETGMWLDANANAEVMFGLSRGALLKTGPGELSPPTQPNGRDSAEFAKERISVAVQGGANQFEWVHRDDNGRDFNCEVRLAVLPGDEPKILVNITDITERVSAREAIVQGDRLKSEFLANMSHELRTPLNSIVGYTDVLLMGIDGELNEEIRQDVEAIQENSNALLRIINDILDLAKIEAGRVILELSAVNVKEMLDDVIRNNSGLLVNKPVVFDLEIEDNLPAITADAGRVSQILNNLVSNAVKFTDEGKITLRAFTESNNWVVLEVEDTGKGIHEKDLQVIFEEFRQADGSHTRTAEGTGLGLTITRRLVHMHGGEISVKSELDFGSIFTVKFPQETRIDPSIAVKVVAGAPRNGNGARETNTNKSITD